MAVLYKLESFEGPLDLLLHLIDKAELDIYNVPISEITDQYMQYLSEMQHFELDVTSEFLVMAATLLFIKSKMLLPKPPPLDLDVDDEEDGVDPRAELIQQLIEYRKYKEIAEHLREKELQRSLIYSREPQDLSPFMPTVQQNPVEGLFASDLILAFQKVLRKAVSRKIVAKIRRDEISVKERMRQVLALLHENGDKLLFSKLLDSESTRLEIVVTLLSILELMKIRKIWCYQHGLFDDIVIQFREEGGVIGFPPDEINY